MAERGGWTADRIRKLRGTESRAAFAARVGVSALTVYRWELPDGAPEARRPRGAILARLEAVAEGGAAPEEAAHEETAHDEIPHDESSALAPLLDALMNGDFRRAEEGLLQLSASGALRSSAARALATQALARIQLWERADVRGAFATLFPQIAAADAGALPPEVAREVYVTAALVFAALDGRVFDPGKVSAYVARAERLLALDDRPGGDPRARLLLWFAQLSAAFTLNDPALVEHHVAHGEDVARDLESPLLACLAEEITSTWGFMLSQPERAARHFDEALRLARAHGFHLVHGRAVAQAARQRVDDGELPEALLETVAQVEATFRAARVVSGWHSLFLAYVAGEANARLGRLPEAEAAVIEGLRVAEELRWPPAVFPMLAARLWILTGRAGELRPFVERLRAQRPAVFVDLFSAIADCAAALADAVDGDDRRAAVDRFFAGVERVDAAGGWSYLRRHMAIASAAVAVLAGTPEQATRALRHADRTLDAVPAPWAASAVDALRGLHAWQEGRPHDARPVLERALATFVRVGDRLHAALTRLVLAATLADLGAPDADGARDQAVEALQRMGIAAPSFARRRAPVAAVATSKSARSVSWVDAIQRLGARGMLPAQLHRTLVDVVARAYPGCAVRLETLDTPSKTLAEAGALGDEVTWQELGDGKGLRLRVGVGARLEGEDAASLAALASVAGLALEVATLRGRVDRAATTTLDVDPPRVPGLVAASPAMRRLEADLARLSRSRATILLTGESGVGKEVVARAIHDLSSRKDRPYVTFNCAAVPRELFEGQLFGYRKGAFTGAASDHPGVIRAANGGTLFLDEVGELPLDVQPKLLRFLENREIMPLGERAPIEVDVRIVAATLRDLEKLVREGRFREDLFYRLQVVPLHVPPLRDRPEDVVALARHFLRRFTPEGSATPALGPDAIVALTSHDWPGNARELRNVIERALAFEPLPAVIAADQLRIG